MKQDIEILLFDIQRNRTSKIQMQDRRCVGYLQSCLLKCRRHFVLQVVNTQSLVASPNFSVESLPIVLRFVVIGKAEIKAIGIAKLGAFTTLKQLRLLLQRQSGKKLPITRYKFLYKSSYLSERFESCLVVMSALPIIILAYCQGDNRCVWKALQQNATITTVSVA